jgi:hypothetical protein
MITIAEAQAAIAKIVAATEAKTAQPSAASA